MRLESVNELKTELNKCLPFLEEAGRSAERLNYGDVLEFRAMKEIPDTAIQVFSLLEYFVNASIDKFDDSRESVTESIRKKLANVELFLRELREIDCCASKEEKITFISKYIIEKNIT